MPVVSVDGPSAAGKGTLSRLLAQRLGYHYLDSGVLYRLTGLLANRSSDLPTPKELAAQLTANNFRIEMRPAAMIATDPASTEPVPPVPEIYLGDECVTTLIRNEAVSKTAAIVAGWPEVRSALLDCQHKARIIPGLVAEGRDMGTQVFPDAQPKFFLTASLEARAERRYQQLQAQPDYPSLNEVKSLIIRRDQLDESRAAAPLKPATDAIHLDSTHLSIAETLEKMLEEVQKEGLLSK